MWLTVLPKGANGRPSGPQWQLEADSQVIAEAMSSTRINAASSSNTVGSSTLPGIDTRRNPTESLRERVDRFGSVCTDPMGFGRCQPGYT